MPFHGKRSLWNLIKHSCFNFMMSHSWNEFLSFLVCICKVRQFIFTHGEFRVTTCNLFKRCLKLIVIRVRFICWNFNQSLIYNFSFICFCYYVGLSYLMMYLRVRNFVFFIPWHLLTCFNGCFDESAALYIFFNYFTLFLNFGQDCVVVYVAYWTRSWP